MPATREKTEDEREQEWIERCLRDAPPLTWERWAEANAILGITVKRKA